MRLGEFKQEVLKLSNQINMHIYGRGYKWQKAHIVDNKVYIIAKCKRSKPLYAIEKSDKLTAKITNLTLMEEYKKLFLKALNVKLGIAALAYLKDYDLDSHTSFSIAIFEKNIEELIKS